MPKILDQVCLRKRGLRLGAQWFGLRQLRLGRRLFWLRWLCPDNLLLLLLHPLAPKAYPKAALSYPEVQHQI